ncbi:hypothetical protein MUK42_28688 [Musa troglodytarum]|uniref:Uncharacterized protein n=1 Tax=Musa troglodytarum TaxID=320322 RepID=A0A9E7GDV3_9LILI|nr:hypothetical protein MUK42_28688 [Musa troglodytarum]
MRKEESYGCRIFVHRKEDGCRIFVHRKWWWIRFGDSSCRKKEGGVIHGRSKQAVEAPRPCPCDCNVKSVIIVSVFCSIYVALDDDDLVRHVTRCRSMSDAYATVFLVLSSPFDDAFITAFSVPISMVRGQRVSTFAPSMRSKRRTGVVRPRLFCHRVRVAVGHPSARRFLPRSSRRRRRH